MKTKILIIIMYLCGCGLMSLAIYRTYFQEVFGIVYDGVSDKANICGFKLELYRRGGTYFLRPEEGKDAKFFGYYWTLHEMIIYPIWDELYKNEIEKRSDGNQMAFETLKYFKLIIQRRNKMLYAAISALSVTLIFNIFYIGVRRKMKRINTSTKIQTEQSNISSSTSQEASTQ
jgi:hypothetical protein